MVVAIACGDPLTSLAEMSFSAFTGCFQTLIALVTQRHTRAANYPSDLLVEI